MQADEDTVPAIEAVNGRKGWIDAHAQLAYKYILVADGNGLAPRFKNALAVSGDPYTGIGHRKAEILWPQMRLTRSKTRQDKTLARRIC